MTTATAAVGNPNQVFNVDLNEENVQHSFAEKVWNAVCYVFTSLGNFFYWLASSICPCCFTARVEDTPSSLPEILVPDPVVPDPEPFSEAQYANFENFSSVGADELPGPELPFPLPVERMPEPLFPLLVDLMQVRAVPYHQTEEVEPGFFPGKSELEEQIGTPEAQCNSKAPLSQHRQLSADRKRFSEDLSEQIQKRVKESTRAVHVENLLAYAKDKIELYNASLEEKAKGGRPVDPLELNFEHLQAFIPTWKHLEALAVQNYVEVDHIPEVEETAPKQMHDLVVVCKQRVPATMLQKLYDDCIQLFAEEEGEISIEQVDEILRYFTTEMEKLPEVEGELKATLSEKFTVDLVILKESWREITTLARNHNGDLDKKLNKLVEVANELPGRENSVWEQFPLIHAQIERALVPLGLSYFGQIILPQDQEKWVRFSDAARIIARKLGAKIPEECDLGKSVEMDTRGDAAMAKRLAALPNTENDAAVAAQLAAGLNN